MKQNILDKSRNIYIKHFNKQYYASLNKYIKLSAVAVDSGFVAPEIIDTDEKNKTITYKHIDDLLSVRNLYLEHLKDDTQYNGVEFFYEIGHILSNIHRKLIIENSEPWAPCRVFDMTMKKKYGPEYLEVLRGTPHANLHCDFGFSNVNYYYKDGIPVAVIIDPCPNEFVTFHVNAKASIYIDLANFIACLDGLIPVSHYMQINWAKISDLKEAFLGGYEDDSNIKIDRNLLTYLGIATVHCYFDKQYGVIKTFIARNMVYNSLKKNLPKTTVD